ncbi:MAG TPA: DEAD/DEAH box helicase, partial [Casimicrobiaceae bacterium]|nr:DEAD/DEAH box helicase [Casimicrobiaceae bacterium]
MNAPDSFPQSSVTALDPFERARAWFARQGWEPFPFQERVWAAYVAGRSGLIHAPTGMGKTYAAFIGPLMCGASADHGVSEFPPDATTQASASQAPSGPRLETPLRATADGRVDAQSHAKLSAPPLTVLWLTPLRALAADTGLALQRAADALAPHWSIDVRTGDSSAATRTRQARQLPTALVTTPESLTLLLSREDWRARFSHLSAIVVDEWHELMSSKRGVQVELALARLRGACSTLRIWGLSATLANLDEALACLVSPAASANAEIVQGAASKAIDIETARPASIERFPWGGHIGLKLLPQVVRAIEH